MISRMARSLRQRGLDVHVVGPESIPFQRVLGIQLGTFIRDIHASHGVVFHLGTSVARIDGSRVTLNDASTIEADFVVLGVGVRPAIVLAVASISRDLQSLQAERDLEALVGVD
jgi:NADPH-dependent 2,4-dienoyl-CoA reductase/sulfur reductase-like enzyme